MGRRASKIIDLKTRRPIRKAVAQVWPLKIKLAHPVGECDCIEIREPRGKDIAKCGIPVHINWSTGELELYSGAMARMIRCLSGRQAPIIDKLSSVDWSTIAWLLARHFLPDASRCL